MKTHKNTWRRLEMRICRGMGGRRTPLSGSNSQHGTSADCIEVKKEFQKFYFEIRLRQNFFHHENFKDVREKAKVEDKIPILFTQTKNNDKCLVVLKLENFIELIKNEK